MARGDDLHPLSGAITLIAALGSGVLSLWFTYVAFVGGTVPLVGWELDGSVLGGVLALMFGAPVITTLGYWAGLLLVLPIEAIFNRR